MNALGVPANLMSLGALDFGLIIDGAIIIVENTLRRIAERQKRLGRPVRRDERLAEVLQASEEMVRPTVYGQIVIFLVFVPCLSFQGVEGKMFSPMVITLMLALASALRAVADVRPGDGGDSRSRRGRGTRGRRHSRRQAPLRTDPAQGPRSSVLVIAAGVTTFGAALIIFLSLGRVFMPTLDEINVDLVGGTNPLDFHASSRRTSI